MTEKSTTMVAIMNSGYRYYPIVVPMDDYKAANKATSATMGFKFMWGRTENGEVIEFIAGANLRKKDLAKIKTYGVVELVTSWCWAPDTWEIPVHGAVKVTKSVELNEEVNRHMNRWTNAVYGTTLPV
jgi:hypothetical protein